MTINNVKNGKLQEDQKKKKKKKEKRKKKIPKLKNKNSKKKKYWVFSSVQSRPFTLHLLFY